MRLLVTGARGMLGQDVVSAALARGHEVQGLDRGTLDVRDAEAVRARLKSWRPAAVVNCAAYTDVDGAESAYDAALAVNEAGARHVAAAAAEVDASVLYLSTDYVFDGSKPEPYAESDAPNPLSAYGRSKLAGERATAAANERSVIIRTSWLFGLAGPNFVETMLRLAREREAVRVVNDQVGCPTYTRDLATALIELAEGKAYGIHHIVGNGRCSWYEFATQIFSAAQVKCEVLACATDEMERVAPRPANSALGSLRHDSCLLRSWIPALDDYLARRALGKVRAGQAP